MTYSMSTMTYVGCAITSGTDKDNGQVRGLGGVPNGAQRREIIDGARRAVRHARESRLG